MLHCDLRVRWKVASDLRFRAVMSEPTTPSFCRISGDLARLRLCDFGAILTSHAGLDSLHVGFSVCVGALTLIGTNIIIMARLEHLAGHVYSACIGCMLMAVRS